MRTRKRRLVVDDEWAGRYLQRATSGLSNGLTMFDGYFGKTVACMQDGTPAGILAINGGMIELVYVSPGHRRRGIASAMLRFAEAQLGPISHAKSVTEDGRLWAMSVNARE